MRDIYSNTYNKLLWVNRLGSRGISVMDAFLGQKYILIIYLFILNCKEIKKQAQPPPFCRLREHVIKVKSNFTSSTITLSKSKSLKISILLRNSQEMSTTWVPYKVTTQRNKTIREIIYRISDD